MKKYYYHSPISIIMHIVVTIVVFLIFILILINPKFIVIDPSNGKVNIRNLLLVIFYYIVSPYLLLSGITGFTYRLTLTDGWIYVPREFGFEWDILQFELKIYFKDIYDIRFIRSNLNSKNKKSKLANQFYHYFMEFTLKNGKKGRICITPFGNKQMLQIFKDVEARMVACGNEVILQDPNEMIKNLGEDGDVFVATMTNMIDNKIKQRKEKRALKKAEKIKRKNSKN